MRICIRFQNLWYNNRYKGCGGLSQDGPHFWGRDMITSTANPQIKNLTALIKKAKERREQQAFVVEGARLCMEAPEELLLRLYVSESYLAKEENRQALSGRNYEVVSDSVFSSVADTQTPQGILGIVRMSVYQPADLMRGERTQLLILEGIQDPGNLGTMLRTGEGAGLTGVIMDRTTVDLFNPKVIRSTMGSIYRMPYLIAENLREMLSMLKEQGICLYAAHLGGSVCYDRPDYTKPCGFLIGNEGNGLTDETADMAERVIIPMEGQVESLNAAVSAAILMYECSRQRRIRG